MDGIREVHKERASPPIFGQILLFVMSDRLLPRVGRLNCLE